MKAVFLMIRIHVLWSNEHLQFDPGQKEDKTIY